MSVEVESMSLSYDFTLNSFCFLNKPEIFRTISQDPGRRQNPHQLFEGDH